MSQPICIRIGTRGSALARRQTQVVADRLASATGLRCEPIVITTDGDRDTGTPLPEIGGKGVFTEALEQALRNRTIDAAVHSLKDIPVEPSPGLCLAAIGMREDPRDALVGREAWTLATLPAGATVGTCSTRRTAQLLAARPDLVTAPLRGNVTTRVRKALRGDYDAIVLAAAGVIRLGLRGAMRDTLPLEVMMPAPGQGALAVQCREDDGSVRAALATLDEPSVRAAAEAERAFLEGLGGGCAAPIAAHAFVGGTSFPWCPHGGSADPSRVFLRGVVLSLDGSSVVWVEGDASIADAHSLGLSLARRASERGAAELIA